MTATEALDQAYYRISKSWHSLSRRDRQAAIFRLKKLEEQADALGVEGKAVSDDIRALIGLIEIAVDQSPR